MAGGKNGTAGGAWKRGSFTAVCAAVLSLAALTACSVPGQRVKEPVSGSGVSDSYALLGGTSLEMEVKVLRGKKDGPSIYLVAGVHGDETAGCAAAAELAGDRLLAGSLYILSPANVYGAKHGQRKTEEERDLNRNFPGDPEGCDAEQIAAAVFGDIEEKKPELVLDLHEAAETEGDRDFLGNSLICQSLDGVGDLILSLLSESERTDFTSAPFTLYGSPPAGSLNRAVTEGLKIPVITVETFRGEPQETRVKNHLSVVRYILKAFEMEYVNNEEDKT